MANRCSKCGTFLNDNERFCPNCGENVMNNQPQENTYPQNNYQQSAYQQNIQPPPIASYPPAAEPPLTTGKWVATILLTTCLGFVSWILLFVWGFSSGPKERQNYCKAMLIVKAIMIGVGILLGVIFSGVLIGIVSEIFSEATEYSDFYTSAVINTFLG